MPSAGSGAAVVAEDVDAAWFYARLMDLAILLEIEEDAFG
jgi:ABC-type methionine transport system permease subunit